MPNAISSATLKHICSVLARDDLTSRRLIRLFPTIARPSELAYYIVYRSECADLPRLVAFRQWLLDEASRSENSS